MEFSKSKILFSMHFSFSEISLYFINKSSLLLSIFISHSFILLINSFSICFNLLFRFNSYSFFWFFILFSSIFILSSFSLFILIWLFNSFSIFLYLFSISEYFDSKFCFWFWFSFFNNSIWLFFSLFCLSIISNCFLSSSKSFLILLNSFKIVSFSLFIFFWLSDSFSFSFILFRKYNLSFSESLPFICFSFDLLFDFCFKSTFFSGPSLYIPLDSMLIFEILFFFFILSFFWIDILLFSLFKFVKKFLFKYICSLLVSWKLLSSIFLLLVVLLFLIVLIFFFDNIEFNTIFFVSKFFCSLVASVWNTLFLFASLLKSGEFCVLSFFVLS